MMYPISHKRKEGVFGFGEFWIVRIKSGKGNLYTTLSRHKTKREAEKVYNKHIGQKKEIKSEVN